MVSSDSEAIRNFMESLPPQANSALHSGTTPCQRPFPQRHRKFIFPYIPIFHDCRTFVCAVQSSARGKSTLPCYLLFKGYW